MCRQLLPRSGTCEKPFPVVSHTQVKAFCSSSQDGLRQKESGNGKQKPEGDLPDGKHFPGQGVRTSLSSVSQVSWRAKHQVFSGILTVFIYICFLCQWWSNCVNWFLRHKTLQKCVYILSFCRKMSGYQRFQLCPGAKKQTHQNVDVEFH